MSLRNYYMLNRIYCLKLDVSDGISIKKSPVWLVFRGAVMKMSHWDCLPV